MNINDIKKTIEHISKRCKCLECKNKLKIEDINVIATTNKEGLFETKCSKCNCSSIINVVISTQNPFKQNKKSVSEKISNTKTTEIITTNDILDIKNFLNNFDGNFKEIL
jgi:hypothetical protein